MAAAVPAGQLGRLLALRSILGFGAGALSPLAFGWILDLTNPPGALPSQWGWAFTMLAAGGILATLAAWFLNTGTARAAVRIAPDAGAGDRQRERGMTAHFGAFLRGSDGKADRGELPARGEESVRCLS